MALHPAHSSSHWGWRGDQAKQLWWGRRNSSTSVIRNCSCWVQRFCCSSDCFAFPCSSSCPQAQRRGCALLSLEGYSPGKGNYSAVPLIYTISMQQKDTWHIMVLRILCSLSHFSPCQEAYKKLKPQILLHAFLGPNYKYIFTRRSQLKPNTVWNLIISMQSSLDMYW